MKEGFFNDSSGFLDQKDSVTDSRIRELYSRLDSLQGTVTSIENQVNDTLLTETVASDTASPMTNFVDNSDFTLSHYAYSFSTDVTTQYILAKWYARTQSSTGVYYINTATEESSSSIRSSEGYGDATAYTSITSNVIYLDNDPTVLYNGMVVTISGSSLVTPPYYVINATTTSIQLASTYNGTTPVSITDQGTGGNITTAFDPYSGSRKVLWDTSTATLATSGGYVVASPLTSKYVFQGNIVYVKMTLAHKPREFTINTSTDISSSVFTSNNHELLDGTSVFFPEVSSPNVLPTGITANTGYHIYNKTANTFQLSVNESGGPALTVSGGSGSVTMKTRIKSGLTARVSLFENAGGEVFKGDKPSLTLTRIGTHSGTTVTRYYILEVQMPSGVRFYSSITSPHNISGTVSTDSVNSTAYVAVSWDKIVGASRYNLYRKTNSGNWYLVGTSSSSGNLLYDYGGGSIQFTPPDFTVAPLPVDQQQEYMIAQAIIENSTDAVSSGELLAVELNSSIQFPSQISGFASKGDQFVQIEFFKANGQNTTLADIPLNSLLIDKVSLSYVYGRWHPSSRDQSLTPQKVIPTNSIASGGAGDGTGPSPGGGSGTVIVDRNQCVHMDTPILVWSDDGNHYTLPARDIVIGDRLVAWDGKDITPSRVSRLVNGISKMNYKIYAGDKELVCSFSHRIIADMEDFHKGTNAGRLDKTVVVYEDGKPKVQQIEGIEIFSTPMKVVTFKMEKGLENYVSSGIFSHNSKDEYVFSQ